MKATVIYYDSRNGTRVFRVPIPEDLKGKSFIPNVLRYLFEATNPDSGNPFLDDLNAVVGLGLRSGCVGDIYIVDDKNYMVNCDGFVEITDTQLLFLQRCAWSNRLMGWNWLQKTYPELGPPVREKIF